MSRPFVSGSRKARTTMPIAATTIGYHRPHSISAVRATVASALAVPPRRYPRGADRSGSDARAVSPLRLGEQKAEDAHADRGPDDRIPQARIDIAGRGDRRERDRGQEAAEPAGADVIRQRQRG